jgi:predicted TIM-barrel fold metal-dependent hydrolase
MSAPRFAHHAHVFPASMNQGGTIDRLIRLLDSCRIDQAVCFAPFPHQCDRTDIDPNPWLAGELKKQPRLLGFGTIDVRKPDVATQVRRAADLGFRGLKLHPNAQDFDIRSPKLYEVYAAAQELKLFLTFHTGVHHSRMSQSRVIDFDDIPWNFPDLKFSMEHVGGYHFFPEALAVIFNHVPPPWETGECNVYAGLASVFTTHRLRFWHLSRERLLELVAQVGADQLIFGLDFPYNLEPETKIAIDTIHSLGLTEAETDKILGGNLRRVLGLSPDHPDKPATLDPRID